MKMDPLLIATIFSIIQGKNVVADKYDKRLLHDLTSNYGIHIRPSQNRSIPTNVSVLVVLRKVIDIEQKNQILLTNCWILLNWNDYKLRWNASEYGGIKNFRIPYNKIWTPDIVLVNNVDASRTSVTRSLATVENTGMVSWYHGAVFRSSCQIDITYFPFDVQTCQLKWASLSYDMNRVDLFANIDKQGNYGWEENDEYKILSYNLTKAVYFTKLTNYGKPCIIYTIKLGRNSLTYVFNFIIPCSLISATGLLVFYVPCLSGEKVTLGISALLSMTVFLLKITSSLPATENVPAISLYYVSSMCLVAFATGFSVLNLNVFHQGERRTPIPKTLKLILNIISSLIGLPQWSSRVKNYATGNLIKRWIPHKDSTDVTFINRRSNQILSQSLNTINFHVTDKQKLISILLQYDDVLNHQEKLVKEEKQTTKLRDEWRHASIVLDRCFLIIFVIIGTTATIIIFSSISTF